MRTEVDSASAHQIAQLGNRTPVIIPYQRVSTIAQVNSNSQDGLGRQKRKTLEAATKLSEETGFKILSSVTDAGISAFHKSNWDGEAGMGLIRSMVLNDEVAKGSIVVFEAFDRMSRGEPMWVLRQMSDLLEAGLQIHIAHMDRTFTYQSMNEDMGQLMMAIAFICAAHAESLTKQKRTRASIAHQVQEAKDKGIPVRFGMHVPWLRNAGTHWEEIPERVELIQRMADMTVKGFGATKIAGVLNSENVPTWDNKRKVKPKKWYNKFILDTLASDALIGTAHFKTHDGTVTIENHYPSVISNEAYAYIQSQIASRKQDRSINVGSSKSTSFVTGIGVTECAYCGSSMVAKQMKRTLKDGTIKIDRFVACSGAQQRYSDCTTARSPLRILERVIVEYCADRINFSDVFGQQSPRSELKAKISTEETKLESLTSQRKRLMKLYAMADDDGGDSELEEQITENRQTARLIETVIEELNKELLATRDSVGDEFVELIGQVRDGNIPERTRQQLREIVPIFVQKIVIANRGFNWVRPPERKSKLDKLVSIMTADGGAIDYDVLAEFKERMESTSLKNLSYAVYFKSGAVKFVAANRKSGDWAVMTDARWE
ncbi:recombinase family protein [Vibrio campbellii]|uniref:recombinase family protein n=1 Tax=Vibrio campbellii TaxID=680 RepID=UPI00385762CD